MFDGGEHFHQFIASSTCSLPIPTLSFNPSFSVDSYAPPPHHQQPKISTNLALESDRSKDPWSNEEVLALLKLRSTMEIWFPDFTWEHVSRKLGELGFKRSGDECKQKFEEESSSHFHHNKNYRILSELDEFYHAHPHHQPQPQPDEVDQVRVEQEAEEDDSRNAAEKAMDSKPATKKRKRRGDKLEMLKGFCEAVVKTMMAKQEELHQKLLHDIIKRDEEKIAREEAWKIQEMDRFKAQIQIRSKEQKSAADRQATIIHFLKQFTCDQHQHLNANTNNNNNNSTTPNSNSNSNSSASFCQNPTPSSPSSILAAKDSTSVAAGDVGKRWPRDEVVALINLRCKMSGQENSKEGKGPLWERISQGMMEMGYKRNAKRCKEKWENINKYFRKTKDSSKKRSVNSRTCPYFHQLSCLYSDGTIVAPNHNHTAPYMPTATTHHPAAS